MGYPKDTWVREYLKGNLLMPQTYAAGAVFLARAVLEEDDFPRLEAATELTDAQMWRMRRTMQAAHQARRIPAGDAEFLERARQHGGYQMSRTIVIDDDRLVYIWNRFREHAVLVTNALAGESDGLLLARRIAASFHTSECRALLRQFRAEYDRRRDGSDQEAALLRRTILEYLDAQLHPEAPAALLQQLFAT